jgi:hypothetical protein
VYFVWPRQKSIQSFANEKTIQKYSVFSLISATDMVPIGLVLQCQFNSEAKENVLIKAIAHQTQDSSSAV